MLLYKTANHQWETKMSRFQKLVLVAVGATIFFINAIYFARMFLAEFPSTTYAGMAFNILFGVFLGTLLLVAIVGAIVGVVGALARAIEWAFE